MSAGKIDNKAESLLSLDFCNNVARMAGQSSYVAEAQVHATLYAAEQAAALVEQQRIANLIAYLERLSGPKADIDKLHKSDQDGWFVAVNQIRDGLGLA